MNDIYAIMIFEIMGRPAEYIKETLSQLIDKMSSEKGCKIEERRLFEPKLAEGHKDIFTTFIEVEATFAKLEDMIKVIFSYMPSHIDIVSPQSTNTTNTETNYLVNELTTALHRYDEIAKRMMIENASLRKQLEILTSRQSLNVAPLNTAIVEEKKDEKKKRAPRKKQSGATEKKETPSIEEKVEDKFVDNDGKKDEKLIVGEDPEKIYEPEMTPEEEEYLEDLDEVLEDDEDKK